MKRIVFLGAMLLPVILLSACKTIEGMGEDIQAGGKALSNSVSSGSDQDTANQRNRGPVEDSPTHDPNP